LAFKEPWSPADATTAIRKLAIHEGFTITLAHHARQRIAERDLNMGDLLYVLKNGFVYESPEQATQPDLWKYKIETRSPNSGNRVVRAVVIPDVSKNWAKIITLMWADE
jgi:Domain of unknown function (DUF4258)